MHLWIQHGNIISSHFLMKRRMLERLWFSSYDAYPSYLLTQRFRFCLQLAISIMFNRFLGFLSRMFSLDLKYEQTFLHSYTSEGSKVIIFTSSTAQDYISIFCSTVVDCYFMLAYINVLVMKCLV